MDLPVPLRTDFDANRLRGLKHAILSSLSPSRRISVESYACLRIKIGAVLDN